MSSLPEPASGRREPNERDVFAQAAAAQRQMFARAVGDLRRLTGGGSIQARCLECAGYGPTTATAGDVRLLDVLLARMGW